MANVLSSNELRKGTVYVDGTEVYSVIDYKHQKYGRGQATIRVKVKNINSGAIAEKTYDTGVKFEEADIAKRNVQYLYRDEQKVYLMDNDDFSQHELPVNEVEGELGFMIEGQNLVALFLDGELISIELPKSVELEVIESADTVAGDTAGAANKKVKLITGLEINVPLFIKTGDVLKVNTETHEYITRV